MSAKKSTKKSTPASPEVWPKVTVGSHSTRTEYQDGSVEFVTDWNALAKDIDKALTDYEKQSTISTSAKTKSRSKK